jgi:hypothetical protein
MIEWATFCLVVYRPALCPRFLSESTCGKLLAQLPAVDMRPYVPTDFALPLSPGVMARQSNLEKLVQLTYKFGQR